MSCACQQGALGVVVNLPHGRFQHSQLLPCDLCYLFQVWKQRNHE